MAEVQLAQGELQLKTAQEAYDQMMRKAELDLERLKLQVDALQAQLNDRLNSPTLAADIEKKQKDQKAKQAPNG